MYLTKLVFLFEFNGHTESREREIFFPDNTGKLFSLHIARPFAKGYNEKA